MSIKSKQLAKDIVNNYSSLRYLDDSSRESKLMLMKNSYLYTQYVPSSAVKVTLKTRRLAMDRAMPDLDDHIMAEYNLRMLDEIL